MAMTSQPQRAGYPFTWPVPPGLVPGTQRDSWVKITQVRTLSIERLGRRSGRLQEEDLSELVDGLLQTIR